MEILVTGGAGFIGSNLVEALLNRGDHVTVVDNLHTGSTENLKEFKDNITFIKKSCGILSQDELPHIDGIFHLGIYSSSPMYRKTPSLVGKSVNDFLNMLHIAETFNVKMVWASTSSIYNGNPTPWREDMPIHVKDYYSEARYTMERLSTLRYDWYRTQTVGMRLFSVYGPKEKMKGPYANLISQFLWWMSTGEPPLIYGDGTQRRDFTYVDDVVTGLLSAFESKIEHDFINIGTGVSYSLRELVTIINNILKTEITPSYTENPIKGYIHETLADTSKAQELLGFNASLSLEEGIRTLVNRQ